MLTREGLTSSCAAERSCGCWTVSVKRAEKRAHENSFFFFQFYRTNKHCYLQQKHGRICLSPVKGINLDKRFTVLVTAWETQVSTDLFKMLIQIHIFCPICSKVSQTQMFRQTVHCGLVHRSPEQVALALSSTLMFPMFCLISHQVNRLT